MSQFRKILSITLQKQEFMDIGLKLAMPDLEMDTNVLLFKTVVICSNEEKDFSSSTRFPGTCCSKGETEYFEAPQLSVHQRCHQFSTEQMLDGANGQEHRKPVQ